MDKNNNNNNPLARRWENMYNKQSDEIKNKLDELSNKNSTEYQLHVIKRKRIIPEKGDVFIVNPKDSLYFFGVVINNNVKNINGEDLYVVMIFRDRAKSLTDTNIVIDYKNLIIEPSIVGKEYWTRGYFYNIGYKLENIERVNYGFFYIGKDKYVDEYGNELSQEPTLLGTFGVATISGIAYKMNTKLIIDSSLFA